MAFKPSIHGWPFGIVAAPDPATLGLGAAPDPDPGLGAGMCRAAQDRYLAGTVIPRDTPAPEPGDPLHAELVRRQAELPDTWARARAAYGLPAASWRSRQPIPVPLPAADAAALTRGEWRAARRRLSRGEPVLLLLLPEADRYVRGHAAWPVLATGWTAGGGRITVSLYDPSRPDEDDVGLSFTRAGELDARLTGGRRLRGFLHLPRDRSPATALRAETFADRTVLGRPRKVAGRICALARNGRLELVARDEARSLLHFRRERGGHWTGLDVPERLELSGWELHSDPVAVASFGALHVFARSYVGDVYHFRYWRGWTAVNRTEQRRAGPRFRLAGQPVAVARPRGLLSVVGRDQEGGLVHYTGGISRLWSAEQVPGEPLGADPVAVAAGARLHVLGAASDGRLLYWEMQDDRWVTMDLTNSVDDGPPLRVSSRPVPFLHRGVLHVLATDPEGRLVHFRRSEAGRWTGAVRVAGVAGDPAVTAGPAGIHVFAAGEQGELFHLRGDREWEVEDIAGTRASLPLGGAVAESLVAFGSDDSLRLVGRWAGDPLVLDWTPDADWTAAPLRLRAGIAPRHRLADRIVSTRGPDNGQHLFATDGKGNVVHVEVGEWAEPTVQESRGAKATPADGRKARKGTRPVVREPVAAGAEEEAAAADAKVAGSAGAFAWPEDGPAPTTPTPPAPKATAEAAPKPPVAPAAGPPEVEPLDLSLLETWPPPPPSARRKQAGKKDA